MARWALTQCQRSQKSWTYTMPSRIQRRDGMFEETWIVKFFSFLINSGCHWQTLGGFLRQKSATTLFYANSCGAYAKASNGKIVDNLFVWLLCSQVPQLTWLWGSGNLTSHCDGVCWWKWVCRVYNIYIGLSLRKYVRFVDIIWMKY